MMTTTSFDFKACLRLTRLRLRVCRQYPPHPRFPHLLPAPVLSTAHTAAHLPTSDFKQHPPSHNLRHNPKHQHQHKPPTRHVPTHYDSRAARATLGPGRVGFTRARGRIRHLRGRGRMCLMSVRGRVGHNNNSAPVRGGYDGAGVGAGVQSGLSLNHNHGENSQQQGQGQAGYLPNPFAGQGQGHGGYTQPRPAQAESGYSTASAYTQPQPQPQSTPAQTQPKEDYTARYAVPEEDENEHQEEGMRMGKTRMGGMSGRRGRGIEGVWLRGWGWGCRGCLRFVFYMYVGGEG
ncbi:hypothetical protein FPV67DRAFT_1707725 [Lyophyllum atratum]|nr:hypothetical protein FPV67DRAFT_1707725 [Lyophyllum atratum]